MQFEIRDSRFHQIIPTGAEIEQVETGFNFTEGPIWHPYEQHLIFSDITGNTMYRYSRAAGLSVFRQPTNMANGNTYDLQGRVLSCEHATSRVTRQNEDGPLEVMASHYNGKELNSPNDIVVKRNGDIYFTDPTSGREGFVGIVREQELDFQGVFRIQPETKELTLLVDDFSKPNGLCFSLDEQTLFINDTNRQHIRAFDVLADGTLTNGRVWAETTGDKKGVPDGMKVNTEGYLFCSGPGGVHIFDAAANCLGVILVPEFPANFTWGDADMCTIYFTATTSLYRVRTSIPGWKIF